MRLELSISISPLSLPPSLPPIAPSPLPRPPSPPPPPTPNQLLLWTCFPFLGRFPACIRENLIPDAAQHVGRGFCRQDERLHHGCGHLPQDPAHRAGHALLLVLILRHLHDVGGGAAKALGRVALAVIKPGFILEYVDVWSSRCLSIDG